MKPVRLISAGALLLLIGAITPLYAQEERAQHQEDAKAPKQEQAKPEKQQAKQQAQPAKQEERQQTKGQQEQGKQQAKSNTQHEEQPAKSNQQAKGQQEKHQQEQAKSNTQRQEQQAKSNQQANAQQGRQGQQHIQRTAAAEQRQRSQPALRLSARGEGRIPDDRFHSNFGNAHRFHIGTPVMVGGYSRFQYGGYWFGFVQPWPADWFYTDDVYVDYIDGGYYLYNPYYPDTRVSINVVL